MQQILRATLALLALYGAAACGGDPSGAVIIELAPRVISEPDPSELAPAQSVGAGSPSWPTRPRRPAAYLAS